MEIPWLFLIFASIFILGCFAYKLEDGKQGRDKLSKLHKASRERRKA